MQIEGGTIITTPMLNFRSSLSHQKWKSWLVLRWKMEPGGKIFVTLPVIPKIRRKVTMQSRTGHVKMCVFCSFHYCGRIQELFLTLQYSRTVIFSVIVGKPYYLCPINPYGHFPLMRPFNRLAANISIIHCLCKNLHLDKIKGKLNWRLWLYFVIKATWIGCVFKTIFTCGWKPKVLDRWL